MSDREFSRLPSAAQRRFDRGFRLAAACAASLAVLTVIVIVIEITRMAAPAVSRYGSDLITSTSYDKNREEFGLLPAIWGTIYTSILALGLATLFGVTAAIVLTEDYLPVRLRSVLAQTIQLLAAIPSVIYGLWGIHVLIPMLRPPANWLHEHSPAWLPFFNTEFTGFSILTSVLVLAVMVLPTITALSIDALQTVPRSLREGAYALGATRWEAIFQVILPSAISGIIGAMILALGRALGETMALAMLVGNSTSEEIRLSLLGPGNTLAALIANHFPERDRLEEGALMYAALVLLAITLIVNLLGEWIITRSSRQLRGLRR